MHPRADTCSKSEMVKGEFHALHVVAGHRKFNFMDVQLLELRKIDHLDLLKFGRTGNG